jgi:hypothetical protein
MPRVRSRVRAPRAWDDIRRRLVRYFNVTKPHGRVTSGPDAVMKRRRCATRGSQEHGSGGRRAQLCPRYVC